VSGSFRGSNPAQRPEFEPDTLNSVRYPFMPGKLSHYDRTGKARMVDV